MDKDYLNFLERMGSFGMELGDQSDEIQHHGVKGQKWGVRRQYKSLRSKGARHLGASDRESIKGFRKTNMATRYANKAKSNLDDIQAQKDYNKTYNKNAGKDYMQRKAKSAKRYQNKYEKSRQSAEEHYRKSEQHFNTANQILEKAVKLPVSIQAHPTAAKIKIMLRDTYGFSPAPGSATNKDSFDMAADIWKHKIAQGNKN